MPRTIQELDREFLVERSKVIEAFWAEEIDGDTAKVNLDLLDFKFETLVDIEMLPMVSRLGFAGYGE